MWGIVMTQPSLNAILIFDLLICTPLHLFTVYTTHLMSKHTYNSHFRLEMLPIEIEERTPSDSSLKFVLDFAKQTGDIRSLSNTDLAGYLSFYFSASFQFSGFEMNRTSLNLSFSHSSYFSDCSDIQFLFQ